MRGAPTVLTDFSGGVNLAAAPYVLESNQAQNALNYHTDYETGRLRKRPGFDTLADLSVAPATFISPAHSLFPANLSTKMLIAVGPVAGGKDRMVSITQGGVVNVISKTAEYTAGQRWYLAQAPATSGSKGPVFAMNGVDTPQVWTGTGLMANWTADFGTIPNGRYLTYAGSRLWCTNSIHSSRLRYSGITGTAPDTGNWDADGFVDLEPEDGEEITGMGRVGPYLVVFKPSKVFVITDLVTGANRAVSRSVGTISPRSIVETDIGLIFYDVKQGVFVTDGSTVTPLSPQLDPLVKQISAFPTAASKAAGCYRDQRYYLSVASSGNLNDLALEYDTRARSWWIHDCNANDFAWLDTFSAPRLYSVSAQLTEVQQSFVETIFTDAGENYPGGSFWTGPELTWDMPHVQKRIRQVRIDGTGDWTLGYAFDNDPDFVTDSGELWATTAADPILFAPVDDNGYTFAPTAASGEIFAPSSISVTNRRYFTLGVGRTFAPRINNNDGSDQQIYAMTIAVGARTD